MTDWTGDGAVPVDDASVADPPTIDEVRDRQRHDFPEQFATSDLERPHPLPPDAPIEGDNGGA